jgi:integrase
LFSFWLSSAVRPSELIEMRQSMVDPGQQLITVIRKGTRAAQSIPAAAEDFVWFRLYQESLPAELRSPELPAWWTLRRPFRPLDYDAARAIFRRINQALGSNWTLHDLRHTAAMRMADDRRVSLTDIQRILGHSSLSTTQEYLRSRDEDVFARIREHLKNPRPQIPATAMIPEGYSEGDLRELFGGQGW